MAIRPDVGALGSPPIKPVSEAVAEEIEAGEAEEGRLHPEAEEGKTRVPHDGPCHPQARLDQEGSEDIRGDVATRIVVPRRLN